MTDFDPTNIKITEQQKSCLIYIQQQYLLDGFIPTAEKISEIFFVAVPTARKWLNSPEFEYLLNRVGIAKPAIEGVLSAAQMSIINMLLNLSDRRSEREKCEEAKITSHQLAAWRKDPTFNGYMQRRAQDLFENSDDIAYMTIIKQMKGGDMKATQLYLEMTGKYQPTVRHDVNLESFVAGIVEILQRRIPDRVLLEVLADDIENLMRGKPVNFDAIPATSVLQPALPKGG